MQKESLGTVSVIVPNFNHSRYLDAALNALLSQSLAPLEVLVVDDASTDESCSVVEKIAATHPSIRLIRLEKNEGPAAAMNRGLKEARGDFVALSASDDIVLPGFFEKAATLLSRNPEMALCCGDFCTFVDGPFNPETARPMRLMQSTQSKMFSPEEYAAISASTPFYVPSQSTLYRKEFFAKYGYYLSELKSLCDFYLNCQMALRHAIGYIPEVFTAYRIAPHSYARALRFRLKYRWKMCSRFLQLVAEAEPEFQRRLKRSGLLAQAGIFMIAYLGMDPRGWGYFRAAFRKRLLGR